MTKLYTTIIIMFLTSTLFVKGSTSYVTDSQPLTLIKQQQDLANNVYKFYVDFEADPKNMDKKEKMKLNIQNFHSNHLKLVNNSSNTNLINKKLTKVGEIWEIAHKLSETKKHSSMLLTTINDLNIKIEELSNLYKETSN